MYLFDISDCLSCTFGLCFVTHSKILRIAQVSARVSAQNLLYIN